MSRLRLLQLIFPLDVICRLIVSVRHGLVYLSVIIPFFQVVLYYEWYWPTLLRSQTVVLDAVQPPPLRPSFPSLPRHVHPNHTFTHMPFFFFFFRVFPSGVATAKFPSSVVPIFCILLSHFDLSHVLFHHIHKPPFWSSPFPLSWQLHPHHPFPNMSIIFPPYMSTPPQSLVFTIQTVPPVLSHMSFCSSVYVSTPPQSLVFCIQTVPPVLSHMPFCSSNYTSAPLQPGFLHCI